jgi:methyl-accepting chemotaxis protein
MRFDLRSVRSKMLVPAAVAVVTVLIAAVVVGTLSSRSLETMAHATREDLPSAQLFAEVRRQLEAADTELRAAVAGGNPDSVDVAQEYFDRARGLLTDAAKGGVVDASIVEDLQVQVDDYFTTARAQALVKAKAVQKEREKAGTQLRENANAEINAVNSPYQRLMVRMDAEAHAALGVIDNRLVDVSNLQRLSVVLILAILLVAAGASGGLAWWISGRTARPIRTLSELTTRIADGDLTHDVQVESRDEIGVLAAAFQRMVGRLREIVGTLKAAAEELALAADQLSEHTRAQATMLERQASGVAETSTTTRELEQTAAVAASRATSVLEVAKRAAEMSDSGRLAAEKSAGELQRIQASVESIVQQSGHLLDQARQAGDIVETVSDIATQSHVLSLNASIEAARAGKAGVSFAVVAQEVRALAEQSGRSAAQIGKIVEGILTAVQATRETTERGSQGMTGSLAQVRSSGDSLREIGDIVRETSDAALQIAAAVQQQFSGIGQIASAMRDLDKGMEQTVGHIRSLEDSAQQVATTATRISGIVGEFKV